MAKNCTEVTVPSDEDDKIVSKKDHAFMRNNEHGQTTLVMSDEKDDSFSD